MALCYAPSAGIRDGMLIIDRGTQTDPQLLGGGHGRGLTVDKSSLLSALNVDDPLQWYEYQALAANFQDMQQAQGGAATPDGETVDLFIVPSGDMASFGVTVTLFCDQVRLN